MNDLSSIRSRSREARGLRGLSGLLSLVLLLGSLSCDSQQPDGASAPAGSSVTTTPPTGTPATPPTTPATTTTPGNEATQPPAEATPEPPAENQNSGVAETPKAPSNAGEKPSTPEKALADEHVVLTTDRGVVVIDLLEADAPRHVENFKSKVASGFYDGLKFHRVVDGFIAQGGRPAQPVNATAIPSEAKVEQTAGSVAMVLADQKNPSGGSLTDQFYICYQSWPELAGATVFARVVQGMDVVKKFDMYDQEEVNQDNQGTLPANRGTRIVKAQVVPAAQSAEVAKKEAGSVQAEMVAVLKTDIGDIVIDLFEEDCPKHSANFKKLVREGFYDGTTFHRVIEGFMAQGGDPEGTGFGGPGYTIEAEIGKPHVRGSLAAARTGHNNPQMRSSGSQFYICFNRTPNVAALDGKYTVYGQVIQGMDVVDKIQRGQGGNFPTEARTKIIKATLEPMSKYRG